MLFTNFDFFLLVLITFIVYYSYSNLIYQRSVLILSSFIFYASNNVYLLTLLIGSILINIITSYYVYHTSDKKKRKLYSTIGVISNLIVLASYKYSPLIGNTFLNSFDTLNEFLVNIPLPIGISFFTFQGISLMLDCYRKKELGQNNEVISDNIFTHGQNTSLYISFFPQLVAGPIVKAREFIPQIIAKKLNNIPWELVSKELILGYFLKSVIADNINTQSFWLSYPYFQELSSVTLIFLLFGYSIQIFSDFAGYSLIAIGISRLFGYNLNINFNFPYISQSFSEFWQRWHISLSTFLREYLYIPLGGNRISKNRTFINLFIVMALGGLWHGAAWSYMIWGAYHGLLLIFERLFKINKNKTPSNFKKIWKTLLIFGLVTLGWLLFKLPDFDHVIYYFQSMYSNLLKTPDLNIIIPITVLSFPVLLYHMLYTFKKWYVTNFKNYEYLILSVLLFLIIFGKGNSTTFIYFQF